MNNEIEYKKEVEIIQKFVDLQESYPIIEDTQTDYESVKAWIKEIMNQGYSPSMLDEMMTYTINLINAKRYEEAGQLILVSSATQEDAPTYLLARELYKGVIFKSNYTASFGIFVSLAQSGHSQAICDLARFYQLGIYVKQNKKYAIKLYKLSMDRGVARAKIQYDKLTKSSFSFF